MTDADRKDAFDLIQQIRAELLLRDQITRADLAPAARRTVETPCHRLTLIPTLAVDSALDRLTRLNALVALI
jgi:hypothetical protein